MRQLNAGLFITLDGVTESPEKWQFDSFDQDMMATMASHIDAEDTILLGRVTYQDWMPYWPTSTHEPYASHINTSAKYVVSTTLEQVEWGNWNNISLIRDNLAETIAQLKQQPGKNMGVAGSPTLVRRLLQANLLDQLTLMIHPVIAGSGKQLFDQATTLRRLKLIESVTTKSGVSVLTYHPA